MGKRPLWFWLLTALMIVVGLSLGIQVIHERIAGWLGELWGFVREHALAIFAAFFLVKGKFVLKLFLKKIVLLSMTGLGKRYLIERVFSYHFKVHFLDHLKDDLTRLFVHIKKNFMHFPLTKKIIAGFAFLGSLGYLGKFMGWMLAMKVVIAKIWSFFLAVVLKTGSAVVYFFTDYVWSSWLAPIVEVVIFGWLLDMLEKVPFLTRSIRGIYHVFKVSALWLDRWIGRLFQHPIRASLRWLLKQTRRLIYRFIGYKRVPAYQQLRQLREYEPSRWERLQRSRAARKRVRSLSLYMQRKKGQ